MIGGLLVALIVAQDPVAVEGQPLAAEARRVAAAMELLGRPLPDSVKAALEEAGDDPFKIQRALQPEVLVDVTLGEPGKAKPGPGRPLLQASGYQPCLIRVVNPAGATGPLKVGSPQSGPVYAGVAELSMQRQDQKPLRENENSAGDARPLQVELYEDPPLTKGLSGLRLQYMVLLIYADQPGVRKATISVGGAAAEVELEARPAVPVKLRLLEDGAPTTARLTFTDAAGHVYPPQPKRLAPDLFFQKQIYRHDGETVPLPPGKFTVQYSRGPEYLALKKDFSVTGKGPEELALTLRRWVSPQEHGWYSGDHHIHAAGCAHYTKPSEGVLAADMFRQVKGEGLNVGCLLTWGPCYDYQRRFFAPAPDRLSEPFTLLKYDVEVSGFGSQALGHVCLLNLQDQTYPGSEGSKKWPTWTTPVLRWAKKQGAVTGYAHSASGLQIDPAKAARRLMEQMDSDRDGKLTPKEAARGLLPASYQSCDLDHDGILSEGELAAAADRAADQLPNFAVPEMNSVGAMEIFVTVPYGLCDFISAMDTARIAEWNCWYHLMNCGYPLKVSGETDFPCMSGTRVGQGRVYVRLGKVSRIDFTSWADGLAKGRSYISDGYAHALEFTVEGKPAGDTVSLDAPGRVKVQATVAFGSQTPPETPYGGALPPGGRRLVGDTVNLHPGEARRTKIREVELVVNGVRVDSRTVLEDDQSHQLTFEVTVPRSAWVAIRQFPQLHTNPVAVVVGGKPIRASRNSALWCLGATEQLWRMRGQNIQESERDEAKATFDAVIEVYKQIAAECPEGS